MGLVPPSLEKYFRTKNGLLMKNNNYYTLLNLYLREQMQIGVKEDFGSLHIKGREKPIYFKITKDNCEQAFADECWKNLRDNEKARTINLYLQKHMQDNYPDIEIPLLNFIQSKEYQNVCASALFCEGSGFLKSYVYIDPECLTNIKGITLLNLVAHELQHCHDFKEVKNKVIPYLTENYVINKNNKSDEIMELPVDGKIKNIKTGKLETVTPELREKILCAKTYISPILNTYKKSSIYAVVNESEMVDFLKFIAYNRSPLEQRAYQKGADTAKQVVESNEQHGISYYNDKVMVKTLYNVIEDKKHQMQLFEGLAGIPPHQMCNLYAQFEYYSKRARINQNYKQRFEETQTSINKLAGRTFTRLQNKIQNMQLEGK